VNPLPAIFQSDEQCQTPLVPPCSSATGQVPAGIPDKFHLDMRILLTSLNRVGPPRFLSSLWHGLFSGVRTIPCPPFRRRSVPTGSTPPGTRSTLQSTISARMPLRCCYCTYPLIEESAGSAVTPIGSSVNCAPGRSWESVMYFCRFSAQPTRRTTPALAEAIFNAYGKPFDLIYRHLTAAIKCTLSGRIYQ